MQISLINYQKFIHGDFLMNKTIGYFVSNIPLNSKDEPKDFDIYWIDAKEIKKLKNLYS